MVGLDFKKIETETETETERQRDREREREREILEPLDKIYNVTFNNKLVKKPN